MICLCRRRGEKDPVRRANFRRKLPMNVNVKNVEKLEKHMLKLTIEVDAKDFDDAVEEVYRKNKKQISIPGFRKGKAPASWWRRCLARIFFMKRPSMTSIPRRWTPLSQRRTSPWPAIPR
jgi:hypothetical protein